MDDPNLPATFLHGRRRSWRQAPAPVRGWVEQQLGEPIESWDDQTGGMSTGIAAVVRGARRALFVKGVDTVSNPKGGRMYVREAEVAGRLPRRPEIPPLLASGQVEVDDGSWVLNVFPALTGRTVRHPWPLADLARVLDAWHRLTPTLLETDWDTTAQLSVFFTGWATIATDVDGDTDDDADEPWHALAARWVEREAWMAGLSQGSPGAPPVLSHIDLRADNIVVADAPETDVWFVDWAHPGLAAPWVDVALLLADVVGSGADRSTGGPIDVLEVWRTHPACAEHDPELLITLVASLAATLHVSGQRDGHPSLPHRRVWAAAMADQLLPFVRQHTPRGPGG